MKTTQKEADSMLVQQVAEVKAKKVLVVTDDTISVQTGSLLLPRGHSNLDLYHNGFWQVMIMQ